jgi:hypothetical protein
LNSSIHFRTVTGIINEYSRRRCSGEQVACLVEDFVVVMEWKLLSTPIGWVALLHRVVEVWYSDLCPDADFLPVVSSQEKMITAVFVVPLRPSGPQYLSCDSSLDMLCSTKVRENSVFK